MDELNAAGVTTSGPHRGLGLLRGCALLALVGLVAVVVEYAMKPPAGSGPPTGGIRGHVYCAGRAIRARVLVESVCPGRPNYRGPFQVLRMTDSLGAFSVPAPPGRYLVAASAAPPDLYWLFRARAGVNPDRARAETLQVGSKYLRADLHGADVTITVHVPEELNGEELSCCLEGAESNGHLFGPEVQTARYGSCRFLYDWVPEDEMVAELVGNTTGRAFLPPTLDRRRAEILRPVIDRDTAYEFTLNPPMRVSGWVRGTWQSGHLDHPRLMLIEESSTVVAERGTDDSGRFALSTLVPGRYRVKIWIPGIYNWIGGLDSEHARVFDLRPGTRIADADLLESCLVFSVDLSDAQSPPWVRLDLQDESGHSLIPMGYSTCGSHSRMENLSPGTYYLHVSPAHNRPLWKDQWYDRKSSRATATPIVVRRGAEEVPVRIHLEKG